MLAGIVATATTGRTHTAVGVGIDGYLHAFAQCVGYVRPHADDFGTNLMARDDVRLGHGVQAAIGVEVATAETYIFYF